MVREPSGREIDKRMTEAIIGLKKKSLGYGFYHEEAIKLEKAQKEWQKIREEYNMPRSNVHVSRLDAPENEDDDYKSDEEEEEDQTGEI